MPSVGCLNAFVLPCCRDTLPVGPNASWTPGSTTVLKYGVLWKRVVLENVMVLDPFS